MTVAIHKNESLERGWHEYTAAQIEPVLELGGALDAVCRLKDPLGHDEISPGRRVDPGPLLPLESVRIRVLRRRQRKSGDPDGLLRQHLFSRN